MDSNVSQQTNLNIIMYQFSFDVKFEKANEIYYRLGIMYKHHQKYEPALAH